MIFLPPDKYESFLQVGSIILDVRNHTCPNTQSNKFVISLKARKMRLIFYLQKNITWFFKLILLFQVCVTWYAQITQNNKFSISFHYLQKEVSDEVDFLHADKDENYLQIDITIFNGDGQAFPKSPK